MSLKNSVFMRYEYKYYLTQEKFDIVLKVIAQNLQADKYGKSTVQSLYFDTDNFRLVRRSLEKPDYKEKMRMRSYGLATPNKKVFLELKKKAIGVVFKRRIELVEQDCYSFLSGNLTLKSQIAKEITYFNNFYGGLKPKMLLLYDRSAFFDAKSDLRVTFDENIRYRTTDLCLSHSLDGTLLIPHDVIMEIKVGGAMPNWLTKLLSDNKIYKTSFSKYGNAYVKEILKK